MYQPHHHNIRDRELLQLEAQLFNLYQVVIALRPASKILDQMWPYACATLLINVSIGDVVVFIRLNIKIYC